MRRALLAVIAGGTLLTGAACDSDAKSTEAATAPTVPATTATTSAPPDYTANTKVVCDKLQTLYKNELPDFGSAMGKMITYREAKDTAEAKKAENAAAQELRAVAAKIRKDTAAAQNPEFKAAGMTSAAKVDASARDRRYIVKVKTLKDLNATVEKQFTEWLSPVAGYCAPS